MISSIGNKKDVCVITLTGSLDVALQKQLKLGLEDAIEKNGTDLVLDFAHVSFIDSSCLGALVSLTKHLRDQKGDIKIACPADEVRSIFQITRLDRLFQLFDSVDDAIDAFYG